MPALNKRQLMQSIERDRRASLRRRLAELRELIRAAKLRRREGIAGVKFQCQLARRKLSANCSRRVVDARRSGDDAIAARVGERGDLLESDRYIRAADRQARAQVSKARTSRASATRERKQESDDEVRRNLPSVLVDVFDRVRRHVKGGPRKTRTEAFLEWSEENPSEVYAMQAEDADRSLARLIAEHERTERASRRKRLASSGEVPF